MSEEGRSRIFMAVIAALVGIIVFAFLCNHPFLETLGVVTVVFILSSLVFGASYLAYSGIRAVLGRGPQDRE
ncbi:MAG: hypothetical protein GXX87_02950 [Euryarchaeota archaeon]|nr:hypothetical protein [Euryarchaeota archaeon]